MAQWKPVCEPCYEKAEKAYFFQRTISTWTLEEETQQCTFANSKPDIEALNADVWATARAWRGESNPYIFGPNGTGKTFLARCLLWSEFDRRNIECGEMRPPKLMRMLDYWDTSLETLRWASFVGVLLIDDVDKVNYNDKQLGYLYEILEERRAAQRRTIFTSNVPYEKWYRNTKAGLLNTSMISAIADRLRPAVRWEMRGKSLRASS